MAEAPRTAPSSPATLLDISDVRVHFPIKGGLLGRPVGAVQAVDGVSLQVHKGETLGLVGESGCGKSTLGRAILQLIRPTAGSVVLDGRELTTMSEVALRPLRARMQMIFQDPYSSLNGRMTVGDIIQEPLLNFNRGGKRERRERAEHLLRVVGLQPDHINRFPHQFSGGQRQRVGIARALALNPEFIVADEPVSALDVSVQAQILNLLEKLQAEFGLTYLFVAHNLSVVRHISDRVAVMYLGQIAEIAEADELYRNPLHPYTQALMSAIPVPNPAVERQRKRIVLQGDVPSPVNPPSGCRFHTRCPLVMPVCRQQVPVLLGTERHKVACFAAETPT
ncbi:MAG TPA: dipeptide ABC transporter ATP-binding protein [Chloroflexota bacterium]|nr:dipeptide ABC transporter ATP-binding protein [Chloroflexota bacterium]